jgi:hypothetical protein
LGEQEQIASNQKRSGWGLEILLILTKHLWQNNIWRILQCPNAFGIPKVCTEIDCKQVFLNRIHNKVRILGSGHMYKTGEMKLAGITFNEMEIISSNPPPPLVWTSKKKKEMKSNSVQRTRWLPGW